MEERRCPKCGRDYSHDVYWFTSLKKHLARKNPCDRTPGTKYIREPKTRTEFNTLDSIVWEPKERPRYLGVQQVVPWIFKEVFSNPKNVCFVRPNVSKNEIIVRVSDDSKRHVHTDEFIKLFVNHVFLKLYTFEDSKLEDWLTENFIYRYSDEWDGIFPDRATYVNDEGKKVKSEPDFMIHMRKVVREFTGDQTNRIALKNILLQ